MSQIELYNVDIDVDTQFSPAYSVDQRACLTLSSTDLLQLIQFPVTTIDVVRQAILTSWHRGLQRERPYAGAYEFKLRGNPWYEEGNNAVESRIMMMSILSALHHQGWYLLTSTCVFQDQHEKDLLILQLGVPPPATSFFAVSFNGSDKLRLIGAPPELIPAVQETIGKSEIQREEWVYSNTAYQFKLPGHPWTGNGNKAVTILIKLLALLDCFTSFGWQLHASIRMSSIYEGYNVDTWFFRRNNQ